MADKPGDSGKAQQEYWERRYRTGGNSGKGSRGSDRRWKWKVIHRYAGKPVDVLDVGCGDLAFWKGRDCESYLGVDISPTIIAGDKELRPGWNFLVARADELPPGRHDVVFCLDVLFHILDDREYARIVDSLIQATDGWLFIFTWSRPPEEEYDKSYQRFRPFRDYLGRFSQNGLSLVAEERRGIGSMYIFRRLTMSTGPLVASA